MKLESLFARNLDINCQIELWLGTHDDDGELLASAYGNENYDFAPWYNMDVVYITTNRRGLVIEVA